MSLRSWRVKIFQDRSLERPVDREIAAVLTSRNAFNLQELEDEAFDLDEAIAKIDLQFSHTHLSKLQMCFQEAPLHAVAIVKSLKRLKLKSKLDTCQYAALKEVLGMSSLSLGEGGSSRIMHELGLHMRLSTRVAMLIATTRARALCLTPSFEAWTAFQATSWCKGVNWMNDAELVTKMLAPRADFAQHEPSMALLRLGGPDAAKRAVACWKKDILMPAARCLDGVWFQKQAQKWTFGHCNWATALWTTDRHLDSVLQTVVWDRCTWRYFRMWLLARMTNMLPFGMLDHRGHREQDMLCPLCESTTASLQHLLHDCEGVTFRPDWAGDRRVLDATRNSNELQAKILFLGRVVCLAWSKTR
ncbi:hypothetical protein AK812_SmicGene4236 [Symbiodinium microadriaticum]|uniref:Uncharacterized protein n=1 Tax=Symbiodinium microadriaticum TaxID=2951 RepID=A0A1Q9EWS5_SYMMI|nr:hypothetical protein AK812_SmicGene4236 [Symbiodinium microadriaticum]